MLENIKIVGIAGKNRSGKDTLAEIFIKNGYYGISVGDLVRKQSIILHPNDPDPISTKNTTETSNYLRSKYGPDFLLIEAINKYLKALSKKQYKGLVVYSIRAPIEADKILSMRGRLIWLEADDHIRYERAMKYLRKGELRISFDEYIEGESLQYRPSNELPVELQMNLNYVRSKATDIVDNSSDNVEEFTNKVAKLVSSI